MGFIAGRLTSAEGARLDCRHRSEVDYGDVLYTNLPLIRKATMGRLVNGSVITLPRRSQALQLQGCFAGATVLWPCHLAENMVSKDKKPGQPSSVAVEIKAVLFATVTVSEIGGGGEVDDRVKGLVSRDTVGA